MKQNMCNSIWRLACFATRNPQSVQAFKSPKEDQFLLLIIAISLLICQEWQSKKNLPSTYLLLQMSVSMLYGLGWKQEAGIPSCLPRGWQWHSGPLLLAFQVISHEAHKKQSSCNLNQCTDVWCCHLRWLNRLHQNTSSIISILYQLLQKQEEEKPPYSLHRRIMFISTMDHGSVKDNAYYGHKDVQQLALIQNLE